MLRGKQGTCINLAFAVATVGDLSVVTQGCARSSLTLTCHRIATFSQAALRFQHGRFEGTCQQAGFF